MRLSIISWMKSENNCPIAVDQINNIFDVIVSYFSFFLVKWLSKFSSRPFDTTDRSRPLRLNELLALETFVNDNVTFLILMKSLVAIIISKIDCTNWLSLVHKIV